MSEWPALRYSDWKDTLYGLHRWAQILGKIRVVKTTPMNHSWNSTLRVMPTGLTTGVIPNADRAFQLDLDLVSHELALTTSDGQRAAIPLRAMSVARFYSEVLGLLERAGVPDPRINGTPNEVDPAIPFRKDIEVRPYDREHATRFADALLRSYLVFERFRAAFVGKASPVQFFWGSFDLAAARFNGRRSTPYAGGVPPNVHPHVMHEAYSHELVSAGFWPGSDQAPRAEYYAYAMPALERLPQARIEPAAAGWDEQRGEFLLPYDAVRASPDPVSTLLSFLESTYAAAAELAGWDRDLLEEGVTCGCETIPAVTRRPRHWGPTA